MGVVHHFGLTCRDIERSQAFYLKYFGFSVQKEAAAGAELMRLVFQIDSPAKIVYLISEETLLELFYFSQEKMTATMGSISHLALNVANRLELFEKLKADGYEVIKFKKDAGGFILFVKDPDGVLIELK